MATALFALSSRDTHEINSEIAYFCNRYILF